MSAPLSDILCINYYFPPLNSPAVIRNYKIASTFCDHFDQVHVLSSDNFKRFPQFKRSIPKNLNIHSVPTLDYRLVIANRSKKEKKKGVHLTMNKKSNPIYQYLLRVQKSFPFNLILAEGNLYYILNAYSQAKKLIKNGKINTIYTSFGPYADHYVGYLLKRKYPDLKWIADFRDLQIEPIYKNVIWKGIQQKMEKKVLAKANLVTTISEGFVDQLLQYNRPTISVLRGVDVRPIIQQFQKFTIAYTGSMYFDYRDPSALFIEIKKLLAEKLIDNSDIQLIYAGRDSDKYTKYINSYQLQEIYQNKGLVSSSDAKNIQSRAHINLLLTSSSSELTGVLTGKIFEYFEAQNPNLCLINGVKDSEIESIFSELNAGSVVYSPSITKGKMRQFILAKYKEWKTTNKVVPTINIPVLMKKYSWENQVVKMLG
ncbi:MAG: hypothetical protein V3V14_13760 [Saprospiraceae bacterium]